MALSLAENLIEVRKRLKRAARKAGRDLSEITLIAVTKNVEPRLIRKAIKEGLRVFGESYIQEAQEKIKKIGRKQKKWHFIGHLQKNKARFAVDLFDCIHSVDTPGLARELNRRTTHPIDVLIQVNISGEKTKHGVTPDEAVELARLMPALKNLNFRGLMAIPPAVDPPERARPYFITLRRLAERINRERIPGVVVHDLSMGMSADFDIAIEEGATMVRVGTAIFGPRETEKKAAPKAAKKEAKGTKTTKKAAAAKKPAATAKKKSEATPKKTKSAAKPALKAKKTATTPKKTAKTAKSAQKAAPVKKTTATKKAATKAIKPKKATASKKTAKASAKKTTATRKAATKAKSTKATKTAAEPKKTAKAVGTKKTAATRKTAAKKTPAKAKAAPKKTGAARGKKAASATKKSAATSKKTTAPKPRKAAAKPRKTTGKK
jgi:hypothetical protein